MLRPMAEAWLVVQSPYTSATLSKLCQSTVPPKFASIAVAAAFKALLPPLLAKRSRFDLLCTVTAAFAAKLVAVAAREARHRRRRCCCFLTRVAAVAARGLRPSPPLVATRAATTSAVTMQSVAIAAACTAPPSIAVCRAS
eukprot:2086164-Pleurochrysis_carterae.AAC.1